MNIQPKKTTEFNLIDTFFKEKTLTRNDVLMGIGDDAALVHCPHKQLLVMAVDTLVKEVHFPGHTAPEDIGYKALAVNLSDLAAMGAEPAWMMLALTLPHSDESWLKKFSSGLFELAQQFNVQLIGGDSACGPLTISVQVTGFLPLPPAGLRRSGAKVGDKIYVSGTLGDAGLGLQVATGKRILSEADQQVVLQRLNRPFPQIKLGLLLRDYAHSAIDISDGLLADLSHILAASGVGATIESNALPLSDTVRHVLSEREAKKLALTAGDDYELCFTVTPEKENALLAKLKQEEISVQCIGEIIAGASNIQLLNYEGELTELGFSHWA